MKKILVLLLIAFISLLGIILFISSKRNIPTSLKVFTIPQSRIYTYSEEKKMKIEYYTNEANSLLDYPKNNTYQLKSGLNYYELNAVEITKDINYQTTEEIIYRNTLSCMLLGFIDSDLILNDCHLLISNQSYNLDLEIGYVAIYKDIKNLNFIDLYGNYSYLDGELHLVGITICLKDDYNYLNSVNLGIAYGNLNLIKADVLYPSEIPNYSLEFNPLDKNVSYNPYQLNAKNNYYFIPFYYETLALIKTTAIVFIIDGERYILEDFCYLFNDTLYRQYPKIGKEGIISYA